MKRGIVVVVLVALASCKGGGGAKKRVPDGNKASAFHLMKTLEAMQGTSAPLLALAEGVSEVCGKGCQCLALASGQEAGNKETALYECPSVCTADARKAAIAAAPGARLAALTAACTPEGIGLTADSVTKVGDDWLAAFVSGQYLADAYDSASAEDKKAYDTAFASLSVPLAPTGGMAGVTIAGTKNADALGGSRMFVAIDAKGALTTVTVHAARFSPKGAELVPATTKAVANLKELAKEFEKTAKADDLARPPVPDDDPPPPEEEPEPEDESGGTGTAMALEEGKMGKKDSVRAEGQYKMKNNNVDPQLAREQAIEQARSAGILGKVSQQPGGAFASITGTGDISGAFDDGDFGGLYGGPSVLGLASTRITDQIAVLADREAPAARAIEVLGSIPGGAVLAVEHKGRLAALPLVFTQHGLGFAPPAMRDGQAFELVVDVGPDNVIVGITVIGDKTEVKGGDQAALEAALTNAFKEDAFADRRDLKISVREGTKVAQLVPVIDAALSAGARIVRLDGTGTGLDTGGSGIWAAESTDPGAFDDVPLGEKPGSGWGYGTGNGSAKSAANVPQVSIGQPNATGDLDKAIIRRYIKRNIPKITYCYEKALLAKPGLAGTVQAQFYISPNGHVSSSNASGVNPDVASCVADVIRNIEFPKPKGGGGVQVNYPFTFRESK